MFSLIILELLSFGRLQFVRIFIYFEGFCLNYDLFCITYSL